MIKVILFSALLSSTAIASDYKDVTVAQSYAVAGTTDLRNWEKYRPVKCDGPLVASATERAEYVESLMTQIFAEWKRAKAGAFWDRYYREELDQIIPIAQRIRMDLADTALELKCLDVADKAYRAVLEIYLGDSYAALRDRAKIGVDDVRSLRK